MSELVVGKIIQLNDVKMDTKDLLDGLTSGKYSLIYTDNKPEPEKTLDERITYLLKEYECGNVVATILPPKIVSIVREFALEELDKMKKHILSGGTAEVIKTEIRNWK